KEEEAREESGERGSAEKDEDHIGLHPSQFESEEATYSWEEPPEEETEEEEEELDLRYPLIPKEPEEDEKVYAWAHIFYDEEKEEKIYRVNEPEISQREEAVLDTVEDRLKEKLDVDFGEMKREEARNYLRERIDEVLQGREFNLDPETRDVIEYYAYRNFIGLGRVEPFMNDKYIEDISCDGVGIPVYVYHRNPDIASVKTNVTFEDEEELDAFVRKLAQRCGRSVSMAEPLVDGSLPDGSRVQATLATDVARRGSNFTIREFTEEPLTPVDIMDFGTIDAEMLAYLWLAIENGRSILIAGPTASGKTSLLNALSLFIPPEMKIISIEDTPELRLPHPNWVPEVARSGFGFQESEGGEVTIDDLLEESLRQRPDYIIVGEVRGEEAYILFQQIASVPGGEEVLALNDDNLKRMPIEEVEPDEVTGVPTFNPETGVVEIQEMERKEEHGPVDELYRITTETGRSVVATRNHSVFENGEEAAVVEELEEGDEVAVPARLPSGYNDVDTVSLLDLPNLRVHAPDLVEEASKELGFEEASDIVDRTTISNYYGFNGCALPTEKFLDLMEVADISYDVEEVTVRSDNNASRMPAELPVTDELLRLIGYFIAEGSLNTAERNYAIQLYNSDEEVLEDMRECISAVCGEEASERACGGYGDSTELVFNNKILFEFLKETCYENGEKRVPDFVFGLSKERIGELFTGLYRGDGYLRKKGFTYYTTSRGLAHDVSLLLSTYGIVSRIRSRDRDGREKTDYEVGTLLNYTGLDVGFDVPRQEWGRDEHLFTDEIVDIERIELDEPEPVYDLSVPGTQNFVGGFGGVMLHNTGHPGMSTIHASSLEKVMDRLTTKPINLPPSLIENLDVIAFIKRVRRQGKYVRRVETVYELEDFDPEKEEPVVNRLFEWNASTDEFENVSDSSILADIAEDRGIEPRKLQQEIERRQKVIEWMDEEDVDHYGDVGKIAGDYYRDPERLLERIESGVESGGVP
ncbi:MAG: ATPase, T2SS/T4P/T4SS family, partial [Candidatus Nanohaloarchaea archaeon]|nr:ATPase, T2SS/T4P/T4SS family [Candidatus Nanohaloarchaea archaeon]